MAKPENDEFLMSLFQIKHDCDVGIAVAEARGELEEARQLQRQSAKLGNMLKRLGGELYA